MPSPLPSLASRQLCHPPAPADSEAAAPLPAASIALCQLEEQPAPLAFHLLPPLVGRGRTVRLPEGPRILFPLPFSSISRLPDCPVLVPNKISQSLIYSFFSIYIPVPSLPTQPFQPHNHNFFAFWLATSTAHPSSPFPTSDLTLLTEQHINVGRDAQGSVSNVLEESCLALARE